MPFALKLRKLDNFFLWAALIAVLSIILQVVSINLYPLDFDEGTHLLIAQLISAGYQPYREIFISYPPFFALILEYFWGAAQSVMGLKILFIVLNSLLLIATGAIGYILLGRKKALLAMLLLALAEGYTAAAVAILADISASAFGVLAVLLTLLYTKKCPRKSLLFFAGLCFGLGMLIKLLIPFIAVLIVIILFARRPLSSYRSDKSPWKQLIIEMVIFLAGFLAITIVIISLFDAPQVYKLTFHFRMLVRAAENTEKNWTHLAEFLADNPIFVVGTILALIFIKKWRKEAWILLVWLILAIVWLAIQIPLRPQHTSVLWTPMALLAGLGFAESYQYAIQTLKKPYPKRAALLATLLIMAFAFMVISYNGLAFYQVWKAAPTPIKDRQKAIQRVELSTSSQDCVISDDPTIILAVGRLPPPELAEVSFARIFAHYLTTQKLIEIIEQRDCQAVVVATDRFRDLMPGLDEELSQRYFLVAEEKHQDTYLVKRDTNQQPDIIIEQNFANGVKLVGVDLEKTSETEGALSFYWQFTRSPSRLDKEFIHFRTDAGDTFFQLDRILLNYAVPPEIIAENSTIKETIHYQLPPGNGNYKIFAGFYNSETGERIQLEQDSSGENAIVIDSTGLQK